LKWSASVGEVRESRALSVNAQLERAVRGANPIAYVTPDQLVPGELTRYFREGVIAVVLINDARVLQAWETLVPHCPDVEASEILPWNASLLDIARHHQAGTRISGHLGDVIHFTPGQIAYIARKIELCRDLTTGDLCCRPSMFLEQNTAANRKAEIFSVCWEIVADVMQSSNRGPISDYCITVERLKYEHKLEDIGRLFDLLRDSGGEWARIGGMLDEYRGRARGPFRSKYISHIFAFLCLIPGLRGPLEVLNAAFAYSDEICRTSGDTIIGMPHCDNRYFSCLCGDRDNIITEAYDGRAWHQLPVSPDKLVILPGRLAWERWGIQPTLHRVLHSGDKDRSRPNVTLLLGARVLQ
jgi:hypothetical protein